MNQVLYDFFKQNRVGSLLDIGANVGLYSLFFRQWSGATDILMLEANMDCEDDLKKTGIDYEISCLSDTEKEVKLFINKSDRKSTGTSYYIEKTRHFNPNDFETIKTKTLDSLIKAKYGSIKPFDFIKIDTQGSELDIIKGGLETVKSCKFMQIETSVIEYNQDSPAQNQVVEFMGSIGFAPVGRCASLKDDSNILWQEDLIFVNTSKLGVQ